MKSVLQLISNWITLPELPTLVVYCFPKAWQSSISCARGTITRDYDEKVIKVVEVDVRTRRDDLELLKIEVG